MAQSIKHPTSAQVMISQFVSLSPASGSGLTAQSPEPASDSVSPSVCSALRVIEISATFSVIYNLFFFKTCIYLFLRERARAQARGGADTEGDTESSAGSRL